MHARSQGSPSSVLPASAAYATCRSTLQLDIDSPWITTSSHGLSCIDQPVVKADHKLLVLQARLLSRPVRLPLCWQPLRLSDRYAGCAQLPPLRAVSAKLLSVRAMSTTAAPPQTKTQKNKKGDKKKDDSELRSCRPVLNPCPMPLHRLSSCPMLPCCRSLQRYCQPSSDQLQHASQFCPA